MFGRTWLRTGMGTGVVSAVAALHISVSIMAGFTANSTGCGSVAAIAHRGEPTLAPEETMPSFSQAIADGARTIEMDVQFTSDGVPVLLHDPTVDRTTNGTGPVATMTFAALEQLDAGSWFGPSFAGTRVPTFDSVLALAAAHHVSVIAELKDPNTTTSQVGAFIASIGATTTPVLVESSWPALLQEMAARSPATPRALITGTAVTPAVAASYGQVLIVDQSAVTAAAVSGWHAAGVKVYAYTPNTGFQWSSLQRAKVDAVITNSTRAFFASCSRRHFTIPRHGG